MTRTSTAKNKKMDATTKSVTPTKVSPKVALPYVPSPGSVKSALEKIRQAATPERFTRDFVTTKLQIKGGTGAALIPFFKKVGLVGSDGAPTDLYKKFRNHTTAGTAAAAAVKHGYAPLSEANEFFYDLDDKDLLALIQQVTGAAQNDQVAKLTLSSLKALKAVASFEIQGQETVDTAPHPDDTTSQSSHSHRSTTDTVKLGLSYSINLVLPATADQSVFNAIFKSLRQHLLNAE